MYVGRSLYVNVCGRGDVCVCTRQNCRTAKYFGVLFGMQPLVFATASIF
ncbi:hypothetical protein CHCC20492_1563 [Bacillus paralicheniformis]|nr:hypothetical protein CHCC20492_1563 [Bacillus paralicheniformis]